MRSRDLAQRRSRKLRLQELLRQRSSLQVVLGAVAIAAIALALIFRPGESSEGSKAGSSARPTVAPAAVVPAPTPVPTAPAKQERIHTVAAGDTLTGIAQKYYGDASKWSKIFEANRDILPSSNALQIGQKLRIPE